MNEKCITEIGIIKKNLREFLELNNSLNKIQNIFESFSQLDQAEFKNPELENRLFETTQSDKKKDDRRKKNE